jgi:hypothetical protein
MRVQLPSCRTAHFLLSTPTNLSTCIYLQCMEIVIFFRRVTESVSSSEDYLFLYQISASVNLNFLSHKFGRHFVGKSSWSPVLVNCYTIEFQQKFRYINAARTAALYIYIYIYTLQFPCLFSVTLIKTSKYCLLYNSHSWHELCFSSNNCVVISN